jgi:hypothetical protein
MIAFRIQDEHDASLIENLSGKTIDKQSLLRVQRFGAYFKTEYAGSIVWMLVSTLPMPKRCSNRQKAIEFSETAYGRPRTEVMAEVKQLIGLDKKEARIANLIEQRMEVRDV